MHRQTSDGHSVPFHVPERTYTPCSPFQTRRTVSGYGRIAAIETQRIEPGKNQHQLVPPIYDYAEEHAAQLDAAEERRREARLVRKEIEKRRQQQQQSSVLHPETHEGAVRRIPMLHDHSTFPASEYHPQDHVELGLPPHRLSNRWSAHDKDPTNKQHLPRTLPNAPSSWELLRSMDEQGARDADASYWMPRKYTVGVSGFGETSVVLSGDDAAYAQAPLSASEENDEGASDYARELLQSFLHSVNQTARCAADTALSLSTTEGGGGGNDVSHGGETDGVYLSEAHLAQPNPESIPQLFIAASNRDAILSSAAAPDWQNYFARYRVTEADLKAIDRVIQHPIRVLLCDRDDGRSMKELFVSFDILQSASVESRISQSRHLDVFLSLRSGKSREFPVIARYGLHLLVDVTIGAGFSVNFLPHLRSARHVKESGAARLQLSDEAEDAMRREVARFTKIEKPKSMPSVKSSAETRKAFQSRMDEYCKKLEDAFPFFVGPAKSFSERSVFSSRNCFSCWLLFPGGKKADSLDFVAVDEEDSLLLVDVLRMLVRLNQPLQSTTTTGSSSSTTNLSEKGKTEGKGARASSPLSLAERRWLCHALCYERPAPLSRSTSNLHSLQPGLAALLSRTPTTSSARQKGQVHPPNDIV